jgi:hypothetical protein
MTILDTRSGAKGGFGALKVTMNRTMKKTMTRTMNQTKGTKGVNAAMAPAKEMTTAVRGIVEHSIRKMEGV